MEQRGRVWRQLPRSIPRNAGAHVHAINTNQALRRPRKGSRHITYHRRSSILASIYPLFKPHYTEMRRSSRGWILPLVRSFAPSLVRSFVRPSVNVCSESWTICKILRCSFVAAFCDSLTIRSLVRFPSPHLAASRDGALGTRDTWQVSSKLPLTTKLFGGKSNWMMLVEIVLVSLENLFFLFFYFVLLILGLGSIVSSMQPLCGFVKQRC